jgi:DNA-binding IclR family transcriptional regulator
MQNPRRGVSATKKYEIRRKGYTALSQDIFDLLLDGEWHSVAELARKARQPPATIERALRFLVDFNLVVLDPHRNAMVPSDLRRLLDG